MPSNLENLQTIRENFITQLTELSDPTKRKPSYSIGGRSVNWVEYMRFLREEIAATDTLIAGDGEPATTITAIE